MQHSKLAGWSGIIFVVLSLAIGVMVPPLPLMGTPLEELTAYFTLHGNNFLIGNYLAMIAGVPSFIFFSYLVSIIKQKEKDGWLWIAVLATVLWAHAVGAVDLIFFQVAALKTEYLKIMFDMASIGFGFFFITQGALAGYAAWAFHNTQLFPKLHVVLGVLTAVLSFLASLGTVMPQSVFVLGGPFTAAAFLIFFVWILALSVAFIRQK